MLTRRRTGADWWWAESHQPECVAVGGRRGGIPGEAFPCRRLGRIPKEWSWALILPATQYLLPLPEAEMGVEVGAVAILPFNQNQVKNSDLNTCCTPGLQQLEWSKQLSKQSGSCRLGPLLQGHCLWFNLSLIQEKNISCMQEIHPVLPPVHALTPALQCRCSHVLL